MREAIREHIREGEHIMSTTSDAVGQSIKGVGERLIQNALQKMLEAVIREAALRHGVGILIKDMEEATGQPWASTYYRTMEHTAKVAEELKRIVAKLPEPERFDFHTRGHFLVYPEGAKEYVDIAERNASVMGIDVPNEILNEQEVDQELQNMRETMIPRFQKEFGGTWDAVRIRDELYRGVDPSLAKAVAEKLREMGVFCSAANGVVAFRMSDTDNLLRAAEQVFGGEARMVAELEAGLQARAAASRGETVKQGAQVPAEMRGEATKQQMDLINRLNDEGRISDAELAELSLNQTKQAASDLLTKHGVVLRNQPDQAKAADAGIPPTPHPEPVAASTAMAETLQALHDDRLIDDDKFQQFQGDMTVANFHLCIESSPIHTLAPDAIQRRAAELMAERGVPITEEDFESVASLRFAMNRGIEGGQGPTPPGGDGPTTPGGGGGRPDGHDGNGGGGPTPPGGTPIVPPDETAKIGEIPPRADAGETVDLSAASTPAPQDPVEPSEPAPQPQVPEAPQQQPAPMPTQAPTAPTAAPEQSANYARMARQLYAQDEIGDEALGAVLSDPSADTFRDACAGKYDAATQATEQVMEVPGVEERTHVAGTQTVATPTTQVPQQPQQMQQQPQQVGANTTQQTGPDIAKQAMEAERREDIGNTQTTADYVQSRPNTGDQNTRTPYGDQCDPAGSDDRNNNNMPDSAEDRDGDGTPDPEDPDMESRPPRPHRSQTADEAINGARNAQKMDKENSKDSHTIDNHSKGDR